MKNILIISDQDTTGLRLLELYSALFEMEQKKLYFCTINILECFQPEGIYHNPKTSTRQSDLKFSSLPKLLNAPRPYKSLHAQSCKQILDIIDEHKINLILIPHFIYDVQRTAQYLQIAKDIRREKHVDIISLFI